MGSDSWEHSPTMQTLAIEGLANSADTGGDRGRVGSYGTLAFRGNLCRPSTSEVFPKGELLVVAFRELAAARTF